MGAQKRPSPRQHLAPPSLPYTERLALEEETNRLNAGVTYRVYDEIIPRCTENLALCRGRCGHLLGN